MREVSQDCPRLARKAALRGKTREQLQPAERETVRAFFCRRLREFCSPAGAEAGEPPSDRFFCPHWCGLRIFWHQAAPCGLQDLPCPVPARAACGLSAAKDPDALFRSPPSGSCGLKARIRLSASGRPKAQEVFSPSAAPPRTARLMPCPCGKRNFQARTGHVA